MYGLQKMHLYFVSEKCASGSDKNFLGNSHMTRMESSFTVLISLGYHRPFCLHLNTGFLAALSSSRNPVVGPSVGRLCEKVTFRVSNGN